MRIIAVLIGIWVAVSASASQAQSNQWSGNMALRHCKNTVIIANGGNAPADEALHQAMCLGVFVQLLYMGPMLTPEYRFCAPSGATPIQAIQIVAKFFDSQPDLLHKDLRMISISVLHETWPCR